MNTALMALEIVARLNRVDFDSRSVSREFGLNDDESAPEEVLRIAKKYGFRAKRKQLDLDRLTGRYPLPAIMLCRDGSYAVILKAAREECKALVFLPAEKKTVEKSFAEIRETGDGNWIIVKHRFFSSEAAFGFRWFLVEIGRYGRIIGEVLLGSFVVQLFGLITPLFTQVILDKVIVHRSMTTLNVLVVAFLAVTLFELLLNISRNYIFLHTAGKLDAKLGAKLFSHLLVLPLMYFEARKVGDIAARVRELDTIREFITNKAVSSLIDLFFSVVFVVVMLLYSVTLSLVVLAFVTVIAILYAMITPELKRRLDERFQMAASSNSYLVESVTGMQTVKSLAIQGAMQKRWEEHLGNYVRAGFRLATISNIAGSVAGTTHKLMTITILFLGVKAVVNNEMTIGQLIAFQMFAGQFSGPVLRLVNLWNEFQQALLAVGRVGDILNHPLEISTNRAISLPNLAGEIKFDKVSFAYNPNSPLVINQVSFFVRPGMSVGIVGRSGSGKSTIAKLLQRLYLAAGGAVYIDGVDVRHMNPAWLRYNIGVVLQENYLFSGTIRENIAMPRPDADMEFIVHAARMAGAHEFISQLPAGYDTMVGERGSSLSGGQKQRIAIARALITKPRILILDEATSALDYQSEQIINRNLRQIRQGRTTLIIAHRIASVRDSDLIIAMDNGRIVETGSHGELLQKRGYYYKLSSLQG